MNKEGTEKGLRAAAYAANGVVFVVVFMMGIERSLYEEEFLLWLLQLAAPGLAFVALWNGPGREEKILRRRVALAELRARLKELGEPE